MPLRLFGKRASPPAPPQPGQASARHDARLGKRGVTGLDLGTTAVKWVQIAQSKQGPMIAEAGYEPVAGGSPSDMNRHAVVMQAVKRLAGQKRLSGQVAVALPLDAVHLRLIKMPALPEAELAQAIRWQVEQTLPPQVAYDDLRTDFLVLDGLGQPTERRLLVISSPLQRIRALTEQLRGAGLTPVAVEIDPLAIEACLAVQRLAPVTETVLLLHLGATRASFSVLVRGQLAFSRTILSTGANLTHTVANRLRVPLAQAEALKRTHGLLKSAAAPAQMAAPQADAPGEDEGQAVAQALASSMENLLVDILHAFKGFSHQVTQSQIQRFDRILVAGGGGKLPGLIEWLQARMSVPAALVDPFGTIPMADAAASAQPWPELKAHFAVAMGLACRDLALRGAG
ncbi:MAG TPA: type IV pilus assembly protein PilM [bacterium]